MSCDNNGIPELPDGWALCTSKSNPGRKYYFNRKTGKSSWTRPQAEEKSSEKQVGRKDKANARERKKKEEPNRKNLKRKSDGSGEHTLSKKKFIGKSTPEKSNTSNIESPIKCANAKRFSVSTSLKRESTGQGESGNKNIYKAQDESPVQSTKKRNISNIETTSPIKQSPPKNIANARLSKLQAQLKNDIQNEESKEKSPKKNKRKSPIETETSRSKSEKSPNINDSKCSTQSPTSESLNSIPSPSQFFAANKIISSMKAQLTEEYCEKTKQKDTFAEIEQGICNQVTEYPYVKHPVTPPQFYEASKLVSAIKSKLNSKVTFKESNITTFATAKDRMDSLQTRLSEGVMETTVDDSIINNKSVEYYSEPMDVDFKEVKQTVPVVNCTKDNVNSNNENVVLVVDTNIFIHELDVIKNVLNSHIKGYIEQPTLLVPWRVINELDRLKDNNNGNGAICKRAKSAMDYLYKSLPENNRIKGQSLRDANSHIYPCEVPDDEILNCCLQQADRGRSVILLSNDKNLCNKACINGVRCIGLGELKGLLESKPQPRQDPDVITSIKHCETAVFQLLSNILENEMRAKYNNLWQHVLFKAPPWTLGDVLRCLLKHWIAVFSDVFPRIEHLITDLKNAFLAIDMKDPQTVSQSEVSNFKELCLDVARKCQIIPEYMELAKSTVDQLQRKCIVERDGELVVIEAFEGLWTVYSSYCAKLASGLGIAHTLEDKLPGEEDFHVLTSKLQAFGNHISDLAFAIQGVLNVDCSEPCSEEKISRLESALNVSLAAVQDNASLINRTNIRIFCTKCRNMLQEAYEKFFQLAELLDVCKSNITST